MGSKSKHGYLDTGNRGFFTYPIPPKFHKIRPRDVHHNKHKRKKRGRKTIDRAKAASGDITKEEGQSRRQLGSTEGTTPEGFRDQDNGRARGNANQRTEQSRKVRKGIPDSTRKV